MAKYPKATWRPLGSPSSESRLHKKHKVILHTMVGSLWGTDSYFRSGNGAGFSGTESHFGVGGDGEVLQWQDTEYQADAQLHGNDDCISIETADHGSEFGSWSGSNVPAWTDAQVEAIAQIVAWACRTHDIPCELIDDTRDSTKGVGYHRQGIDPYREAGEHYSNSYGKVCPGNRRVAQIPRVITRANEILNGGGSTLSWNTNLDSDGTGGTITPMARGIIPDSWGPRAAQLQGYAAATLAWLRNKKFSKPGPYSDERKRSLTWFIRQAYRHAREGRDEARDVPQNVWSFEIPHVDRSKDDHKGKEAGAATHLRYIRDETGRTLEKTALALAEVKALRQEMSGEGIDTEAIAAEVREGIEPVVEQVLQNAVAELGQQVGATPQEVDDVVTSALNRLRLVAEQEDEAA